MAAFVVVVALAGCAGPPMVGPGDRAPDVTAGDMIDDVSDAGDRARELAGDAAHRTLEALAVQPGAAGATRVSECTDALGTPTGQRFAEYSSGSALGAGTLADDDLDRLPGALGVSMLEDSVDLEGRRLVAFVVDVDGTDVVVRVSRLDDGAGLLTATTPCVG